MEKKMEEERLIKEFENFLDKEGKIETLPSKNKKKLYIYYYIAGKIPSGEKFTEREINEIINRYTSFKDPATIRRELFMRRLVNRTADGSSYWKEEDIPPVEEFIKNNI